MDSTRHRNDKQMVHTNTRTHTHSHIRTQMLQCYGIKQYTETQFTANRPDKK